MGTTSATRHHNRSGARSSRDRGFTLPELVMVLVLVGILAVFAVPRVDFTGFSARAFEREVTNALRHAQKIAMASGCPVQVAVDAGSDSYSVAYTGGGAGCGAGALPHPAEGGNFAGSGRGIASGGSVTFDAFGRTASGLVISLNDGGQIIVESGSGYVRRT